MAPLWRCTLGLARDIGLELPAWPGLLGLQLVLIGALVGVALGAGSGAPAARPPLEERLLALDLPTAQVALLEAIDGERIPRALTAGGEGLAKSFLSLSAQAAGLEVRTLRFSAPRSQAGIARLEADLILEGDPFDLPPFLDGLRRQASAALVEGVVVMARTGQPALIGLRLRYLRPDPGPAEWVEAQLGGLSSGAGRAGHLLHAALKLRAARRFAALSEEIDAQADGRRARLAVDLPARLIALRHAGGRLVWTAAEGLRRS